MRLSLGAGLTLANAEHMQSYFGVTAAQSVTSGYAAYKAEGGARAARVSLALSHAFSARTSVTAGLSVTTLLGDAQDSPLTRRKSAASGLLALR